MNIGEKIKRLRLRNSLTQEELASRCDLSKGFISLLERDLTSPSITTLCDVLDILGTNLNEFFSETVEEKIVYSASDVFVNEDEENKFTVSWLISNAQKNEMEPIYVEIKQEGILFDDEPHAGEEFGYVLSGQIELIINKRKYTIKKGESFYYKSNCEHKLHNPFKRTAMALLVSTPPSF